MSNKLLNVKAELHERLKKMKILPAESFGDVITRSLDELEKLKEVKNGTRKKV